MVSGADGGFYSVPVCFRICCGKRGLRLSGDYLKRGPQVGKISAHRGLNGWQYVSLSEDCSSPASVGLSGVYSVVSPGCGAMKVGGEAMEIKWYDHLVEENDKIQREGAVWKK